MLGREDAVRKVSIVRQEQEPFSVVIQAPYRKQPLRSVLAKKVHHRAASLRIVGAGYAAFGFVQYEISTFLMAVDRPAVDSDCVDGGVHFRSEFLDDNAVDADAAICDQLFGPAPGSDSSPRNSFLQPFLHAIQHPRAFERRFQDALGAVRRTLPGSQERCSVRRCFPSPAWRRSLPEPRNRGPWRHG